jgi:drug/metabolite transporter (DMT)-like permease
MPPSAAAPKASPPRSSLTMVPIDWLLLVALSLLWGGSFLFGKVAVQEIPPLTLALGRVSIAALALAVFAHAVAGPFPRDARTWWTFTVMATLNNVVPFTLIFWSQIYISIGLASILNATSPLFGVLVAHVLTHDDRLTGSRVVGLLAGFVGVVILIGPDMLAEFGTHVLAELACLAASCSYAFGAVISRRVRGLSPITVATGQLTVSTIMLAPIVLLFDRPSLVLSASSTAIAAMVALALLSSALAYWIYFRLISRAGATNALLVTFLIPASAILLGMLLLGEHLYPHQFAGMVAIAVGLAAIDGRPARWLAGRFIGR